MNLIRRAIALIAVSVLAALVTVSVSACGGAATTSRSTTTGGAATNGLEKQSPADVLQEAAAALEAAKSVHVTGTGPTGRLDLRMTGRSSSGALEQGGVPLEVTIVGGSTYVRTDQAGLKMIGVPKPLQRQLDGRWLKVNSQDVTGFTLADFVSELTAYHGPLEPKVRQASLNGKKVVVVSWQHDGKLYVANTGPAYPLRGEFKGQNAAVVDFTDYGAPLHITAPSNAIDVSNA